MRFQTQFLLASLVGCALIVPSVFAGESAGATNAPAATVSTNTPEKVGYAIGINVGLNITNNLQRLNYDASSDEIMNAIRDVLTGHELKFSPDEARQILTSYQQEKQREAMEKQKALAAKNEKEGEAFLAENKTKPGIKVAEVKLPDGKTAEFQYKVLTEGTGEAPKDDDTTTVKYRGTFINGTEFDNSEKRGGQATVPLNGIIKGWSEALKMMKVGSKWELFIPASLGYGDQPHGAIEPGSTLIFDVELVGVGHPKPVASQTQPLTSDIVRVPSEEERKQGKQIEFIKPEEAQRMAREAAAKQQEQKKQ